MPGEFHFLRPEWFFALIPGVLVSLLIIKKSKPLSGWEKICDPALLKYQTIETGDRMPAYQTGLRWLIPLLLVVTVIALAGPSWSKKEQPVFQKNTPLVIILDLSYSMNATDIKPSRLERSKLKIMDILQSRQEGQSALIAYAGDTHVVSPLTNDNKTIISLLPALTSSIMPVPGSQMSDALSAAEQLLKNAGMPNGKIIILTDGVDDQNAYAEATQLNNQKYQVSVIGVGSVAGSPVPSPQQNGFMKDALGQAVLSKLNPATLEELAQSGGGEFHSLSLDDSDFRHALTTDSLDDDQAITQQDDQIEQWIDQGAFLTLFIIPFALLAFRKGILIFVVAVVLFPTLYTEPALSKTSIDESQNNHTSNSHSFWGYLWKTPDQKGQQAFNKQDYAAAAEHFENSRWKAGASYRSGNFQQALDTYANSDDADSWYNRGNALANLRQFPESINAYNEAIKRDPELKDAQANKKYIEELLSKQQQKQEQNKNSQDQNADDKDKKDSKNNKSDKQRSEQKSSEEKTSDKQDSEDQESEQQDQQSQNGDDQEQQDQNQATQNNAGQEEQEDQEDQNQSGQNSSEQEKNQQQAEENNESANAQDSDLKNEQDQQQDKQSQDSETAKGQQQEEIPVPFQQQDQDPQQTAQPADIPFDESDRQESKGSQSKRPAQDVMSQLSQEEQQSLNQWLQRIPDDPSELLRRKFYMNSQIRQRQQMTPPQSRGNPW